MRKRFSDIDTILDLRTVLKRKIAGRDIGMRGFLSEFLDDFNDGVNKCKTTDKNTDKNMETMQIYKDVAAKEEWVSDKSLENWQLTLDDHYYCGFSVIKKIKDMYKIGIYADSINPIDVKVILAVDKMNKRLQTSKSALMWLFRRHYLGWYIPVEIDYNTDKNLDEANDNDNYFNPERIVDTLGEYWSCCGTTGKTGKYRKRKIVLYSKTIEKFSNGIGVDSLNVYAYVLAHELFHAYQDFHMDFISSGRKQSPSILEPEAEFFAIRFVYNELKDGNLADKLVESRISKPLWPYSLAIDMYGDIRRTSSEYCFIKELGVRNGMWGDDFDSYLCPFKSQVDRMWGDDFD